MFLILAPISTLILSKQIISQGSPTLFLFFSCQRKKFDYYSSYHVSNVFQTRRISKAAKSRDAEDSPRINTIFFVVHWENNGK